jgi:DNA-binding MarR family transcriptional regulator
MPASTVGSSPSRLSEEELAAWAGFLRAHARLVGRLDAELRAEHGFGISSYEVLVRLAQAPNGMRLLDLSKSALITQSGMSRLVDRLESEGLVHRASSPDDGRGCLAVITEAGRRRLRDANRSHLAGVRRLFLDRLDGGEMASLGRLWERLEAAPEEELPAAR